MRSVLATFRRGFSGCELVLLLLAALVVHLVLAANVCVVNNDGVRYINAALELLDGHWAQAFVHEKMLAYPLTLSAVLKVIPDWLRAGQAVSVVFLTLTVIPLYLLARDLAGRAAAVWGCCLFVTMPLFNTLATSLYKDGAFLFFIVSALFLGVRGVMRQRWIWFLPAFLSAAFASLFRLEGIVLVLAFAIELVVLAVATRQWRVWGRCLLGFAALPLLGLVLAGLWALAGGFTEGSVGALIGERIGSHYFGGDPMACYMQIYHYLHDVEELFPGGRWRSDFFEIARHHIWLIYLIGIAERQIRLLMGVLVLPLVAGFFRRDQQCPGWYTLFWVTLSYWGMGYFFILTHNFLSGRYLAAPTLFLLPLAGLGMTWLFEKARASRFPRLLTAALLLVMVLGPLNKSFNRSRENDLAVREAGMWLRGEHVSGVLTNSERTMFHARFPRSRYAAVEERAVEKVEKLLPQRRDIATLVVEAPDAASFPEKLASCFSRERVFTGRRLAVAVYRRMEGAP
ncbi:MAG: glycosyltransferase family 39 protein [Deltaproteobacteria bacterium]|nr:glycosyltransferase family 39 protein [Deltaproteobacteria bacterium]